MRAVNGLVHGTFVTLFDLQLEAVGVPVVRYYHVKKVRHVILCDCQCCKPNTNAADVATLRSWLYWLSNIFS